MIFDMTKRTSGGGGGGYTLADIAAGIAPNGSIEIGVTTVAPRAINKKPITTARSNMVTMIDDYGLAYNDNLTSVFMPKATVGQYALSYNPYMTVAVASGGGSYKAGCIGYCTRLQTVDMTGLSSSGLFISGMCFANDPALTTLILRHSAIISLQNIDAFISTPFASGGTGGTIYIPKSLYDHLGDGTSSDYKAASIWSTMDGYGTITWAKIEGSIYETQYADGTPIPTT